MADLTHLPSEKRETTPDAGELTHEGVFFTPAVDIYETDNELVLVADMPGVDSDDLDIDLDDDTLSIVGKVKLNQPSGDRLLSEYRMGNYFRNFCISDIVSRDSISAVLTDGVLTLTLPKSPKAVPRKIPIACK
jgi:HSP20 family protein